MHKMLQRVLGFDFGLKRIGVAVGNLTNGTSEGIATIAARDGEPNWDELKKLQQEWSPDFFIVGLPLNMDGGESAMSLRAKQFGIALRRHLHLRVAFVDERLTTNEADRLLTETGKSVTVKRRKNRDRLAAELIVRTYLNDNRRHA